MCWGWGSYCRADLCTERFDEFLSGRVFSAQGHPLTTSFQKAIEMTRMGGVGKASPEMETNLIQAVKVECSDDAQRDPEKLKQVYDSMEDRFLELGLNVAAVEAQSTYFNTVRCEEGMLEQRIVVQPLHYEQFVPKPLPPRSVRLCVAFLADSNLSDDLHKAACDIFAQGLTSDHSHHTSWPSHYHVTIFMTSQPHDMRPNPFHEQVHNTPTNIGPRLDILEREIQTMRDIVGTVSEPITLEVYKILLADSGTLLLCLMDISESQSIYRIRKGFRESFPGAPRKQSTIYHMTLGRIVTPTQLQREQRERIQQLCSTWSETLQGRRCVVNELHHVIEEQFTTVFGERTSLSLGDCQT